MKIFSATPHDAIFKQFLHHTAIARDFLEAHNQNASDWGASVAVSSGYVLVGAPRSDGPAGVDAGWAFLFKDGVLVKSLLPPSQQAGEQFGYAVAIDGDRLAIGSRAHDSSISVSAGLVDSWVAATRSWRSISMRSRRAAPSRPPTLRIACRHMSMSLAR